VGVYGPVYEYRICAPYKAGGEGYLDSEKYELAHWDWSIENSITQLYTKVNAIRRENTSLQQTENIVFCETNNDQVLAYYKYDDSRENETLMVVSLNTESSANAMLKLPAEINTKLRLTDLLTGASYVWDSEYNYVELAAAYPFHLFKIERI
jgi:starch synthase (maltosyl-transferring)